MNIEQRKEGDIVQSVRKRIRNWECGMRNLTKAELGMRPPAHRGIRLRPGGNAEFNEGGIGNAEKDRR